MGERFRLANVKNEVSARVFLCEGTRRQAMAFVETSGESPRSHRVSTEAAA